MRVVHIQYPLAIMDTGEGIAISQMDRQPRIGSTIEKIAEDKYLVKSAEVDVDCPGGKCPIR